MLVCQILIGVSLICQADWLILEINEKTTLHVTTAVMGGRPRNLDKSRIGIPYWYIISSSKKTMELLGLL